MCTLEKPLKPSPLQGNTVWEAVRANCKAKNGDEELELQHDFQNFYDEALSRKWIANNLSFVKQLNEMCNMLGCSIAELLKWTKANPNVVQNQLERTRYFQDMTKQINTLATHFSISESMLLEQKIRLILKKAHKQIKETKQTNKIPRKKFHCKKKRVRYF